MPFAGAFEPGGQLAELCHAFLVVHFGTWSLYDAD